MFKCKKCELDKALPYIQDEWAEQQEFNLIEKVQSYGDSKEYTLNINGVRFAVSSYYDFEKDFFDLITKHRL
jgi:hypothetical protein